MSDTDDNTSVIIGLTARIHGLEAANDELESENDVLMEELERLREALEEKEMQLVACMTVSFANTERALSDVLDGMLPKYKSPALDDVVTAVRREITLLAELERLREAIGYFFASNPDKGGQWLYGRHIAQEKAQALLEKGDE